MRKIAEVTGGECYGPNKEAEMPVMGAVRDNREVRSGNLFVCIRGERTDGHLFANNAFERGAACCLTERLIPDAAGPCVLVDSTLSALKTLGAYYRRLFDIPIIGISGSVGKTTTKEMVSAVLGEKLHVLKTSANLNNELGVPLTLMSLNEQHEAAVIEMGISEFGEMSRLAQMVRPDVFIITKIGYSHTDTLGDLEGVLRAKTEAFAFMNPEGIALFNGDDDLLWEYVPKMRKITYGLDSRNDIHAENVSVKGCASVSCEIILETIRLNATIPSYGSHLVMAALPAAFIGKMLGLSAEEILRGFTAYKPVDGRASVSLGKNITLIDDCYNANPHSVEAALKSLSTLGGRRLAILGDMRGLGDMSEKLHREIGASAAQCGIDCLICCGDMAKFIFEGFTSALTDSCMLDSGKASYFSSKEELITALPGIIMKGDALLVKASHAMHFEDIVGFIRRHTPNTKTIGL